MKPILFALLMLVPSVAGADKVWKSGKGATWDCKQDPVVSITHGKGTYVFKGACTSINVVGGANKVTAESADEINVAGAKNDVTVGTVGTLNLTGSKNKVTWKAAKSGDAPAINNVGKDNVIAQAGGAKPTAPSTPATAPATSSATAVDCAKQPHFMTSDNNGTFALTGKCDMIMISGNNNKVTVDTVRAVQLSGNKNTVEAVAVDAIETPGNDNTVSYKKALTAAGKVKIANPGNGNKITAVK